MSLFTTNLEPLTALLSPCIVYSKQIIFSCKSHPNIKKKMSQNCFEIKQSKPNTNKEEENIE